MKTGSQAYLSSQKLDKDIDDVDTIKDPFMTEKRRSDALKSDFTLFYMSSTTYLKDFWIEDSNFFPH